MIGNETAGNELINSYLEAEECEGELLLEDDWEEEEKSIELHPAQSEIFSAMFLENLYRYMVVRCSRGWGKSFFAAVSAITAVNELLELNPSVPHKVVYIICPTYDQVVDVYYPLLAHELGQEDRTLSCSRASGRFIYDNNVELRLVSYESVERLRGKGAYLVIWDEVSSCNKGIHPKEAWEGVIQPCIVTRWSAKRAKQFGARSAGRMIAISTPKGYNFHNEMFEYSATDPAWGGFEYDFTTSPYLDPEEIERLRHKLDPIEFASEYLAKVAESAAGVFYNFSRKKHVWSDMPEPLEHEDIHLAIDFNVGIQATSMFVLRGNQLHCFDEMKGAPDTETLAKKLKDKFPGRRLFAYPDPSGRARKTSAAVGVTDFNILEAHGIKCLAHSKAPAIVDSAAAVNRKLLTAAGDVSLFFHPRCLGTITSIERTKWVDKNPDMATIDKSEGIEHFSDGVRYICEYLFPVLAGTKRQARGFGF
jgi:hypothetical protein